MFNPGDKVIKVIDFSVLIPNKSYTISHFSIHPNRKYLYLVEHPFFQFKSSQFRLASSNPESSISQELDNLLIELDNPFNPNLGIKEEFI